MTIYCDNSSLLLHYYDAVAYEWCVANLVVESYYVNILCRYNFSVVERNTRIVIIQVISQPMLRCCMNSTFSLEQQIPSSGALIYLFID